MGVKIKGIDSNFLLSLHNINGRILAEIDSKYLQSISKSITDIDKIEISTPKYILNKNKIVTNPTYLDIKNERIINLNEKESYVIKDVNRDGNYKKVMAYSREINLTKNDLKFEDIGFRLMSSDEEKDIYSLNDYMYEQTGWKFGHIDDKVKFNTDGVTEKMRWQESVVGYWYDYLMNTVSEQFECVVIFDSYNKLVNLYAIDGFGDGIQIYLDKDNYIKSLEVQSSSSDIVTMLRLEGNAGLTIKEGVPSGQDYIEDYSYFIENREMSDELIKALSTYNEMVKKRTPGWVKSIDLKNEKETELLDKKQQMLQVIANIKAATGIYNTHKTNNDSENMAIIASKITEYRDEETVLDVNIRDLENEIEKLQNVINEIVVLCQKKTATDDNGYLIFNEKLLNELKDYIFTDTFTDDSYLEVGDLLDVGKRKLSLSCKPSSTYNIDVVDFTSRIIDNKIRQHWKGTLGLGDIIILYDEDNKREEFVYLTSFNKNPNSKDLTLELSNFKTSKDNIGAMARLLTETKKISKLLKSKRYLWIEQEKDRINLKHKKGGI